MTMTECKLCCEAVNTDVVKNCNQCGYSFETAEVCDKDKLQAAHARLTKSKKWVEEIKLKRRLHQIQIAKYGHSWTFRKTSDLLKESSTTTSVDIRLAEDLEKHTQLLKCRNKTQAKQRLNGIRTGVAYDDKAPEFEYENELQSYLHKNWHETAFGKDWELKKTNILREGRYNTKEVGEIDLLAKHRNEQRWLVVELKRDQSSDETVGQILRYMGWVKENLAGENGKVQGVIIAKTAESRLLFALALVRDIVSVYCYHQQENKLEITDARVLHIFNDIVKLTPSERQKVLAHLQEKAAEFGKQPGPLSI